MRLFYAIKEYLNRGRLKFILSRIIIVGFACIIVCVFWLRSMDHVEFWRSYFRLQELFKIGLFWNIVLLIVSSVCRMCYYNKVPIWTLIGSNLITLYYADGTSSDETYLFYNMVYDCWIMPIAFLLTIILLLKKI